MEPSHRRLLPQKSLPSTGFGLRRSPSFVFGVPMVKNSSDRRICPRLPFKTAMRVRVWKSGPAERGAESVNLSETGTLFNTDMPVAIGSELEILLKMPEEITGKPSTEWRCAGHVVRLQSGGGPKGTIGVGVEFDYYQILRSRTDIPL